jgi:SAM-dependent methyltransferase
MESLRKAQRVAQLLQEQGVVGFAAIVTDRLRRATGQLSAEEKAWNDRKIAGDTAFDASSGFDTGGIQRLYGMDIAGPNARFGVNHIASDPDDFARAMAALKIDHADFTFMDLGSGKGRAVLMAAKLPFRKVVGVEFATELVAAARANVAGLPESEQARIELVHADVVSCPTPEGPLVVYLYNPFGAEIVRRVAIRLLDDWRVSQRPIIIAYVNPLHADVWLDTGWGKTMFGQSYIILEPRLDT